MTVELFVATTMASASFLAAWAGGLRRDPVAMYMAASLYLIYFLVPAFLVTTDAQLVNAYASDGSLLTFTVLAFATFLALSSSMTPSPRSPGLIQTIHRHFGDNTTPGTLSVWLCGAYTVYLAIQLIGSFDVIPTGVSRATFLLVERQEGATEGSYSFLTGFVDIVGYAALMRLLMSKRRLGAKLLGLWFVLQLTTLALSATHRSTIVFLIATNLVVVHFAVRRLNLTRWLLIPALVLIPIALSFMADYRAGIERSDQLSLGERLVHGSSGLATAGEMFGLVESHRKNESELEMGKQLYLTSVLWVPRVVWDEKPAVSFSFRKTEEIYGEVGPGNWIRTFTVFGEGYAQFGYFGMLLYGVFLTGVVRWCRYLVSKCPLLLYSVIGYVISFPLLVRADLFALVSRIIPLLAASGVLAFLGRHRGGRRVDAMGTPPSLLQPGA